jgi:hypothetical protein
MATDPEMGPIAKEVIDHLRDAKELSELNLRTLVEGAGPLTVKDYVDFIAGITNAIQQDLVMLAAFLDRLTARVAELEKGD